MPKARGKKEKSFGYAGAISKTVPLAEFGLGTSGWLFVSKARIKVILSNQSHPSSAKCTVNSPGVEPFMAASRCFCCRIILVCSLQSSSACLSLKKIMSFLLKCQLGRKLKVNNSLSLILNLIGSQNDYVMVTPSPRNGARA